jgi:hypothetical protein
VEGGEPTCRLTLFRRRASGPARHLAVCNHRPAEGLELLLHRPNNPLPHTPKTHDLILLEPYYATMSRRTNDSLAHERRLSKHRMTDEDVLKCVAS